MSRWFRFYDDAINDPKILKLTDALRWQWVAILCVASKNDGMLPPTDDVALMLRVKPSAAAAIIAGLKSAGLLDSIDGSFSPHNWNGRQYKSDVSTERVKRFRKRERNVSETPPESESEQKQTEAKASDAGASDPRTKLFGEGLKNLEELTGKGPDSCRSFIGKCLKTVDDDASVVLGAIDDAHRNRVADAGAWIMARLKAKPSMQIMGDPSDVEWRSYLKTFKQFGKWKPGIGNEPGMSTCRAPSHLLREFGFELGALQ